MTPEPRTARSSGSRLFFALWPDDATRDAIETSVEAAVTASGGRPTPWANLHITLAFLGRVEAPRVEPLRALQAAGAVAFELVLDRLEYRIRARMLWLAPSAVPAPLVELERRLWQALRPLGHERERRPFRPHMTVARRARPPRGTAQPVTWRVESYSLVESLPGDSGSRYIRLHDWQIAP
jgi:2'-5' RNA ligase